MIEAFERAVQQPAETISHHKQRLQAKVVAIAPAYFPEELAVAAGAYPVNLWGAAVSPEAADAVWQSFSCTIARTMLAARLTGALDYADAFAFSTICDTLQNLSELYRRRWPKTPVLQFVLPMTSAPAERRRWLEGQFRHVTGSLAELTGREITAPALRQAAALYLKLRTLLVRLYEWRARQPVFFSNRDFYTIVKAARILPKEVFAAELEKLLEKLPAGSAPRPPAGVLVSGIVPEPATLLETMDALQMPIVADDLLASFRTHARPLLPVVDAASYEAFLFTGPPCSMIFQPENRRLEDLAGRVRATGARGVIFWQVKFCEPEAFDHPDLIKGLKERGVPVAYLEVELPAGAGETLHTRLQGFREILLSHPA